MNLLGSSVVHKEKHVRKQEHKLKIMPMNADVIVLGLQSKDQAEQWLRVRRMHEAASCFPQSSGEWLLEIWSPASSKGADAVVESRQSL